MKAHHNLLLILCVSISFSACKENTLLKLNLSGVYTGEADILIEEVRTDANGQRTTITLTDTTIIDTIKVAVVDIENAVYLIDRSSNYFSSFYDFEGEITIDEDNRWFISYQYDRNWLTEIQFDPKDDAFNARMFVNDIFESYVEDSLGNLIYSSVRNRDYEVRAFK